ncbi:MAG: type I pullulanase, partial [Ruminococcus sp.]|nr:type I pullulanase [Ruminococcus sp.]
MITKYYSNKDEIYATYDKDDLGFVYSKESTTFKVWAPAASQVLLKLYSTGSYQEDGATVLAIKQMNKDESNGVWSTSVDGDLHGVYYTYLVQNGNKSSETQDVYSKATGVNSARSMVVDLERTNPEGWENDKHVLVDEPTKAIVWEIHVRDFSSSNTSGVSKAHRGTYLAFTETDTKVPYTNAPTCLSYLKELGITHVQLNPVFDFGSVNEATGVEYNWGYDPVNYNVPEGSYSTDPYHGEVRIKEFKQMVKALHDNGIGVIMDVVYNHTYYGDESCFERTVPNYYYRKQGSRYLNSSGCGNVTATEKIMFRKFMIDSLKYWATEYHIDGFRFDLMACHDYETMNLIREELDKIDPRILMYGEPWTADSGDNGISGEDCCTKGNAHKLSSRIGMFNDDMRNGIKGGSDDDTKGYIQGSNFDTYKVLAGMLGASSDTFGRWAKRPSQCITYASAHDNLTLWDKLLKSNWVKDFNTTDPRIIEQNKLSAAFVMMSLGVPFMLAGEEFARTKQGVHNSYKSPDSINSIDWSRTIEYKELVDYYKGLIDIRKKFPILTDSSEEAVHKTYMTYNGKVIAGTIANINASSNEYKYMAIVVNNTPEKCPFELKSKYPLPERWYVILDHDSASGEAIRAFDNKMEIRPYSAFVIVDADSYDKLHGITDKKTVPYYGSNF